MKKIFPYLILFLTLILLCNSNAQEKTTDEEGGKIMKRFVIERTFPNGLEIPVNNDGRNVCLNVVLNNTEEKVTWVHSYVSEDKKKTYCIYDAPSAEAIRKVAEKNNLPVNKITEVSVLDPYFYR